MPSVHEFDIGSGIEDDIDIWKLAAERGRVSISKDVDFADLASRKHAGLSVVWVRMGNTRKQALLDRFTDEIGELCTLLESGDRLIELR